ncbi:MAG: hypothetical protein Q4F95_06600 [Oscillospiraceae bacterium]|nr:hypothetical protein [Oscillospiraceae bacterium]
MNKLISAELLRVVHSGMFFRFLILLSVLSLAMPFMTSYVDTDSSLSMAVKAFAESSALIIMLPGLIFTVIFAGIYRSRLYYYEIMDGCSTHKIILSKLVSYILLACAFIIIPYTLICGFLGIKNGTGDIRNIWLLLVLFIIIIVHFICIKILTAMILRNMAVSTLAAYTWMMAILMVNMFIFEAGPSDPEKIQKIFDWFPVIQLQRLAQTEYSSTFIITVFTSFVIETALFYILTFISYRRKNFK